MNADLHNLDAEEDQPTQPWDPPVWYKQDDLDSGLATLEEIDQERTLVDALYIDPIFLADSID